MNFENWWQDKHPEIRGTPEISERDYNLMRDAWEKSKVAERDACVKACEAAEDTGDNTGIERDVAVWNRAVAYCVRRLKERSNVFYQQQEKENAINTL